MSTHKIMAEKHEYTKHTPIYKNRLTNKNPSPCVMKCNKLCPNELETRRSLHKEKNIALHPLSPSA